MRRIGFILFVSLLAGACCAALAGCAKGEGPVSGEEINVAVQVNVDARAVESTDGTPSAAEAELHSLRVYAFIGDELVGYYFNDAEVADSFLMEMAVRSLSMQTVDFYVIANEAAMVKPGSSENLTEDTPRSVLDSYTFTALDTANCLPMFYRDRVEIDVATDADDNPQTLPGHAGHTLLKQELDFPLRRPVAKLGVFAAKEAGESAALTVTGLTLLKEGTRMYNYLMPQNETVLGSIGTMSEDILLSAANGEVTAALAEGISDAERKNPENYTPVLAVPFYPFENPFGSGDWSLPDAEGRGNVLRIDYTFGGEVRSGTVYLPPMLRNHYYAVCCLMRNDGKIAVEYLVADWDDAPAWDDMEFAYPTYDNPLMPLSGSVADMKNPTVYCSLNDTNPEAGDFSVRFRMTAPAQQEWKATLMDASPADFEVRVYQGGEEVTNPTASEEWYTITVRALNPDMVGQTVRLGIAITPTWLAPGETTLLLINGLTDAIAWPDSGNMPEYIEIEQIPNPND